MDNSRQPFEGQQPLTSEGTEREIRMVEITHLQPYDRNPRHDRNPEFDRIKASIRAHGLDQPLVITQRPGAMDYTVHSGGNTRLLILKELFAETGDNRFSQIPCLFRPWQRESEVLLAHLRENDLRGDLTFIDKAQAVYTLKQLLEDELDVSTLTQRQLHLALQAGGYTLSEASISRMGYAVRTLLPLMPQALHAGLGKAQVQRIRTLDKAARALWQQREVGDDAAFEAVFAALCRRYDAPDWDTDLLRSALETELAEAADVSVHIIRVEFDAQIAGRVLTIPECDDGTDDEAKDEAVGWLDAQAIAPERTTDEPKTSKPAAHRPEAAVELPATVPRDTAGDDSFTSPVPAESLADPQSETAFEPLPTQGQSGPTDLKSLRARAWTLAARLAQRNGLGALVVPLSGKGLGFLLNDVPDPALADQLDEESLSQVSMVWWCLAACAEMTVAPLEAILPHLPTESVLRHALEEHDAGLLFTSIWTLDPGQTGYRLWRRLGELDWRDLLNLMATYRQLYQLSENTQTPLWE